MGGIEWLYGAPVDVALIRAFEAEFDIRLPEAYVRVAAEQDGAICEPGAVPFASSRRAEGFDDLGIGQLISHAAEEGGMSRMRRINHRLRQVTRDFVMLSEAGNGWEFAFDYGAGSEPSVVLFTYDATLSGEDCIPVASSFEDLLDRAAAYAEGRPVEVMPFVRGERIGEGRRT